MRGDDRAPIPKDPIRFPRGVHLAALRAYRSCREPSRTARGEARTPAWWSGRSEPPSDSTRRRRVGSRSFVSNRFSGRGQSIEASSWPILTGRDFRILPSAREQPHLLQSPEGAVQRPVGREQTLVRNVAETLGKLVPMKLLDPGTVQACGGF